MFTITTPAPDRNLLTLAEMKAALGITNGASDAALTALGAQISDMIAIECRVPVSGATPPTMRSETIVETIRRDPRMARGTEPWRDRSDSPNNLVLARFPVTSVTSVLVDDLTLAVTEYELNTADGALTRLFAGAVAVWTGAKFVVTYAAGFVTVPEPLKLAAITILREQWSSAAQGGAAPRDPMLKREKVEGISDFEWFNSQGGSSSGAQSGAFSSAASAMLMPYKYWTV